MTSFGDIVKLKYQDSTKYAGIITSPVLRKLLDDDNIKLSATLTGVLSYPPKVTSKKTNQPSSRECAVRIVVHGLKRDRFVVGNLISDAGLYLQQPSAADCDIDVEYCNPHYLVRPGSQMPKLDQLSISPDTRISASSEVLGELNKSRLLQIFDLANDEGISSQFTSSSRLSSTLKAYVWSHLWTFSC